MIAAFVRVAVVFPFSPCFLFLCLCLVCQVVSNFACTNLHKHRTSLIVDMRYEILNPKSVARQ